MISLTSPVKTKAHDWPAGLKVVGLCIASVILFAVPVIWFQLVCAAATFILYALAGPVFLIHGLRRLWPIWPFVVLLAVWHVLTDAAVEGVVIILRMLTAVALANLVTMTTRLDDMMSLIRRVLRPFVRFGINLRAIELAVALVIRFTPVLAQKGAALSASWRARTTRRAGWRVIVPFMVLALDDADHVADALRARGGFGNEKGT